MDEIHAYQSDIQWMGLDHKKDKIIKTVKYFFSFMPL